MAHHIVTLPNPNLRNLSAAVKLRGTNGMCFHRSVALCMDLPESSVVVGTLRAATPDEQIGHPERSKLPFIHAWVEFQDKLFAPTTIESLGGLVYIRPEEYYRTNGATDIRRLPRAAVANHVADKHVMRQLLFGIEPPTPGYLVAKLLDAVGLKYMISPSGGIIPVTAKDIN